MYAITFDFDTSCLEHHFKPNLEEETENISGNMEIILPSSTSERAKKFYTKAYYLVRRYLEQNGFEWKQGSVYFFKDPNVQDNLIILKIIKRMAKKYPWFLECSRDVRILKIEAQNDVLAFLKDDD